ncbi:MAG: 16S rRNA (cytosine(967)-C(5))-methyltransferase RsmB [Actinomycetota bacterium]
MSSARAVALEALLRVEAGAYTNLAIPELLRDSRLEPRDRALVTDLVNGTVRMRRALDHLLAAVSSRPLGDLDPTVRAALRLGAYQLWSGVAPHAAVGETVGLVPTRARGFVNGVLRALDRSGPPWALPTGSGVGDTAVRTSHPDWLVALLIAEHGAAAAAEVLDRDNLPPAVTLRPNPTRTDAAALTAEIRAAGGEVTGGSLVPDALLVRHGGDPGRLAAVREGRATPQDQASQAVAALVDARPGDRVLDVAAAPGGKTTAIAEGMDGRGLVVAADRNSGRLRAVRAAARRLGLDGVVRTAAADGTAPPWPPGTFDRVLLDAPCSGLGVLRRRPDARWRVRPATIVELAALQRELLAAAADALRPGGRLVYAVCTLTAAETIEVDAWAAEHLPHLVAEPLPEPWRSHGRGGLLLPSDLDTDGMFILVLRSEVPAPAATLDQR